MHLLSISKAAKLFDVSRPTLQKALKDGRLTGIKSDKDGFETWQIDPSELARLYKLREPDPANLPANNTGSGQPLATAKSSDSGNLADQPAERLQQELQEAQAKITGMALELAKAQTLADERLRILTQMAEDHRAALESVTRQLPKPDDQTVRKTLWQRIFR